MRRLQRWVLCSFVLVCAAGRAADVTDRLAEALGEVGFTKSDLGYRPKGYWSRFPDPSLVPHKLHFFDSLFAEPLRTYDFTLVMAQACRDLLSGEKLAADEQALFKLTYFLGIQNKVGGFRGYSANLDPQPVGPEPLLSALIRFIEVGGRDTRIMVFGKKADWPDPEAEMRKQLEGMSPELRTNVASLVLNVIDACEWRELALRKVDVADLHAAAKLRGFHGHSSDGQTYPHEVDDVARVLDEASLYYAAQKAVQAAHDAARSLAELVGRQPESLKDLAVSVSTPMGRVVVAGTGDDTHASDEYAILIDLGGQDTYEGGVAASSLDTPVSIVIDVAGNDVYRCADERRVTQGAGLFGAGVLIDLAGNDTYEAKQGAQGYGFFGLGLLADYGGDDTYQLDYSGQGAAYFGIGLHLDVEGNDTFYLYGDGQGFGGPGGVGVLANGTGDDTYTAEPLAEKAGRADYHSAMKIAVSQAQGCGAGMRADGSHGHAWAGGLGALIDLTGNDRYESGNWSIGAGYWFGTGLLYDGDGDDVYRSVYFTQASGAHFCIGAIIDEGGNDQHILYDTGGAGLAFGWDFAVALLLDRGGDDLYEAKRISLGCAQIRSNALLIDIGGNDTYRMPPNGDGFGSAKFLESYAKPSYSYGPYSLYGNSIGVLLDIGGEDRYLEAPVGKREEIPLARAGDNVLWLNPARDDPNFGHRNFGIGYDVQTGTVLDVTIYDDVEPAQP